MYDAEFVDGLSTKEWVFFMMPLRHSGEIGNILHVMQAAWTRTGDDDVQLLKRFIKATYRRCPTNQRDLIHKYDGGFRVQICEFARLLQFTGNGNKARIGDSSQLFKHVYDIVRNKNDVIVSLSGGVDSMVCAYLLKLVQDARPGFGLYAVHINYCNKPHALEEEQMVISWCNGLGIPCFTRQIVEIQRQQCMDIGLREVYETYTRNVRFNTYKAVWDMIGCNDDMPTVILGHNKDDCFENVITNILHQQHYDNLLGMNQESMLDDIVFVRPLITTRKSDIRRFAWTCGVPHLFDSTPAWAMRGKIRDCIVPAITAVDPKSVDTFVDFAAVSSDCWNIVSMHVDSLVAQTKNNEMLVQVNSICTFKMVWMMYILRISGERPSQKAMENFMTCLNKWLHRFNALHTNTRHAITVNKHVTVELYKTKNSCVRVCLKT